MKYWKIGDFSKKLGKHNNIVDGWFRELEIERKLHYIYRVNDEKVYDKLPNNFDLRPFPKEYENQQKTTQIVDFEKMRATFKNEIKEVFNELSAA